MAMWREDIKEQVQQATDLVRLIGEQVSLRPKGREFVGLCPFHDDSNPSMSVSPSKQIYKCFSCGAGGDAFSFVMNYHKMTFPEAIKHLAEREGIELKEQHRTREAQVASEGRATERQQIAEANVLVTEFFTAMLKHDDHGQIAREYLEKRGINEKMVSAFNIGYAPDRWDGLVQMVQHKTWDRHAFEQAGLLSSRSDGSYYDRMRHRLIFPIADALGRPIAFGGRKLREEDEPKYLNSPETRLFNKSRTLYGLHLAKKPIIDAKVAVIVEGYTDVIACHQQGQCNVVATLGTALTREHVAELRRFSEKVVLVFDADAAGDKAAERAVELFLTGDLDVAIAHLPDGADPFDLMQRSDGVEAWQGAITRARDVLDYQFDQLTQQLEAADTLTARQRLIEQYLTRIAQLGLARANTLRRTFVVQRLAELLKMPEPQINELLRDHERTTRPRVVAPPTPTKSLETPPLTTLFSEPAPEDADLAHESSFASENQQETDLAPPQRRRKLRALEMAERQIIGSLVRNPDLFDRTLEDGRAFDETMTPDCFVSSAGGELYRMMYQRLAEQEELTLTRLLGDLAVQQRQDLADLLTLADAEVDQIIGDDTTQLRNLWQTACEALLNHNDEMNLQSKRQVTDRNEQDKLALAQQILEHRRNNPSPARIARVRE